MTWAITAIVVTVVAAGTSARLQQNAAEAQSNELERQADQEKIAAEGRELQRRQRLNKILSANIVSLSGSGISGEGSPQSISLESAKQASVSEGLTSLSDKLKQAQLRRQAKNVRSLGGIQAASTLLTGVASASQIAGG